MAHRSLMHEEMIARERELYSGRFWGLVGIETLEMEPGRVVNRVHLRADHLNYNDVVHGGVISTLIDSAAGGAVRSLRTSAEIAARPHATSDLHVVFLSPVRGSEMIAVASVVRAGRTAVFVEVDVTDDRARLVARGMVTFIIGAARGQPGAAAE